MDFFAWLRLLFRNRFAVHLPYLYIAVIVTFSSMMNTSLRFVQHLIYGRRIRNTVIDQPPIFIVGHWRTGTTLLHELLTLDPRYGYPTTFECLSPNHFLLTEKLFTRMLWFLVPSRRPMDNMKAGYDRPQEEEFALCMLGQPSPYLTIAFPNRPPQDMEYLDLEYVAPQALERWKLAFLRFLQKITFKTGKRLVLKTPLHMCRIKVLLELFPKASFVHIVRDPFVVFLSTVNLWKVLYRAHGFQTPNFHGLEEHVFETGVKMYRKLEETRSLVPPSRFFEVRYEDLVADPVAQIRAIYEHFQLDGFESVLPRIEAYLEETKDYKTNKFEMTAEQAEEITRRWGEIIDRYGYARKGAMLVNN